MQSFNLVLCNSQEHKQANTMMLVNFLKILQLHLTETDYKVNIMTIAKTHYLEMYLEYCYASQARSVKPQYF